MCYMQYGNQTVRTCWNPFKICIYIHTLETLTKLLHGHKLHKMKVGMVLGNFSLHKIEPNCNLGSRPFHSNYKSLLRNFPHRSDKNSSCIGSKWWYSYHKTSLPSPLLLPLLLTIVLTGIYCLLHKFLRSPPTNTRVFDHSFSYLIFAKTESIYPASPHAISWEVEHAPTNYLLFQ